MNDRVNRPVTKRLRLPGARLRHRRSSAIGNAPQSRQRPGRLDAKESAHGERSRRVDYGVTGQDGAALAELLLEKGYVVHGVKRRRFVVQYRADRPLVPGPAPRGCPVLPPLRRSHRCDEPDPTGTGDEAGRDLQPRRAEPRAGQLRDTGVHRQHRRTRDAAPARGAAYLEPRRRSALLPGIDVGALRQRPGGPPGRDNPVPAPQSLRRGQALRPLDHGELPPCLRYSRLQRHRVQPRGTRAWRDLRHPQDHPGGRCDRPRKAGSHLSGQPRRPARLGPRARLRGRHVAHRQPRFSGRLCARDRRDALREGVRRARLSGSRHRDRVGGRGRRPRRAATPRRGRSAGSGSPVLPAAGGQPPEGDATKARTVLGWEPRIGFEELVCGMVRSDLERVGQAYRGSGRHG